MLTFTEDLGLPVLALMILAAFAAGWIDAPQRAGAKLARLIGAEPRTEWLAGAVARDDRGFVLTGRDIPREGWLEDVPPEDLATTLPGVFAGGDIRSGSMKRVASATGEGASVVSSVHAWLAH